jgi:predicted DNA-binding helix-hairpin-helix protein
MSKGAGWRQPLYDHPVNLQRQARHPRRRRQVRRLVRLQRRRRSRDSSDGRGIGSNEGMGICHSYAPDGRCISLLKILLTNFCQYDCLYCVNRVSSNVPRARFTVDEVVQLTLDFYRRNCIEGLFLSSGIIRAPTTRWSRWSRWRGVLREEHDFRGYIHLKTIPEASPELLQRPAATPTGCPSTSSCPPRPGLAALAPEKDGGAIKRSMARLRVHIDDAKGAARDARPRPVTIDARRQARRGARRRRFAAAGQSTQMIVGADATDDATILATSAQLYGAYGSSASTTRPSARSPMPRPRCR